MAFKIRDSVFSGEGLLVCFYVIPRHSTAQRRKAMRFCAMGEVYNGRGRPEQCLRPSVDIHEVQPRLVDQDVRSSRFV